jgi:hypothetical protein
LEQGFKQKDTAKELQLAEVLQGTEKSPNMIHELLDNMVGNEAPVVECPVMVGLFSTKF